ncbi:MAG: hypothetical protein ABIH23_05235 [bacterium]
MIATPQSIASALFERPERLLYSYFKDRNGDPFDPFPYQVKIFADILLKKTRFFHLQQCTQTGKTEILSLAISAAALLRPRERINVIAPTFRQTSQMFGRCKQHLLYDNPEIAKRVRPDPLNQSEMHVTHDPTDPSMDSVIACHSAGIRGNGESILGFWGSMNVLDESGSIPDSIYYEKILRMGAAKSSHAMLVEAGTPHRGNHFKESSTDSRYASGFHKVGVDTAIECGAIDSSYYEMIRSRLHPRQLRTWYEAEFPLDEDSFFPDSLIEPCIKSFIQKEPSSSQYALGLDFAKELDKSVFTLGEIKGNQIWERGILVFKHTKYKEQMESLSRLCDKFRPAIAFADSGGAGSALIEDVERMKIKTVVPVSFSASKTRMYTTLHRQLEAQNYLLLDHEEALTELSHLEHEWIGDRSARLRILAPTHAIDGQILGDDHPDSKALLSLALSDDYKAKKGGWFDPKGY